MSIMGLFYTLHINTWSTQRKSIFFSIAITLCLAFLAAFSPQVGAADASWTSPKRESISYGGKIFTGPHKNDTNAQSTIGWSPDSKGDQRDVTFYKYTATQQALSGGEIIWFPKGASVDGASSANYSVLEKSPFSSGLDSFDVIKKDSTVQVKLALNVNPTDAAMGAVKSVFRSSISSYINSQCNSRYTNAGQRTECINNTNAQFNECWNIQTGSISFATSIDPQQPAKGIKLADLAFCIASKSGTGKASQYTKLLEDSEEEANSKGAAAYSSAQPEGAEGEEAPSSCQIDGIGWIVCPVTIVLAGLTDNVYGLISNLLEVKVFSNTTSNDALRTGWSTMLSIANVAFVIAFLIIIYSQLVGGGLTNFTIKRMLPRLVIAAILVNVSFWICALAVDVSNIVGYSLQDIFTALSKNLPQNSQIPTWEQVTINLLSGGAIAAAGFTILAVGSASGVMLGFLGILWPLLIAAIFAVLVALVILTARQAIVIILIIISPLAFVAFLLPNTEKWFTRWRDLFATMLFLFPIMSLVFGGSQYAARLVMTTSPSGAVVIMAIAIQVIPLALTPLILKFSGGLLSRIGGMVNNPNKGPLDRIKNAGSKRIERRQDISRNLQRDTNLANANRILKGSNDGFGRQNSKRRKLAAYVASRGATGDINLDQKQGFAKAVADESAQTYFAERVMRDGDAGGKFAKSITGSDSERAAVALQASAKSAIDKIERQDKESRAILFRAKIDPTELNKFADEWKGAVASGDTASARASADILLHSGSKGVQALGNAWRELESTEEGAKVLGDTTPGSMSSMLRQDINGSGLKGKDNGLASLAFMGGNLAKIADSPSTYSELTPTELVGQSAPNLQIAAQTMSPSYAQQMLENKDVIKDLSPTKAKILEMVRDGKSVPMPSRTGLPDSSDIKPDPVSEQVVNTKTEKLVTQTTTTETPLATPSNSRTTPPSTAGYSQTASGLVLPDSAIEGLKKANTAAQTPTVINNITNSNETLNQTDNNWLQVNRQASVPAAGRRSSGAPVDQPSSSTRQSSGTRAIIPPDDPTNTDINRFI